MGTEGPSKADRISKAERLGALCNGHPENVTSALTELLPLLDDEVDPEVLSAVADALGRMWDPRCLPPLLTLVDHPDREVRLSVAGALHGAVCNNEVGEGIAALIQLSADSDGQIRDWATFALAGCETDTPEVRSALWARVEDPEGDTCGEAMVGLALRGEPRVVDPILQHLARESGNLIVEAAAELGDPAALPLLLKLRDERWAESDPRGHLLDEALAACTTHAD